MTKIRDAAMLYLCRREHSAYELAEKLTKKGYDSQEIANEIAECQRLDLQSDRRFAESLTRLRIRQGYGPLKIHQELRAKQVDAEIIEEMLSEEESSWLSHALAVWIKKYKNTEADSFYELQKRQRFLLYRGFSTSVIAEVVKEVSI